MNGSRGCDCSIMGIAEAAIAKLASTRSTYDASFGIKRDTGKYMALAADPRLPAVAGVTVHQDALATTLALAGGVAPSAMRAVSAARRRLSRRPTASLCQSPRDWTCAGSRPGIGR
jgi:hypothetical protein